jgi:hypothetical protein
MISGDENARKLKHTHALASLCVRQMLLSCKIFSTLLLTLTAHILNTIWILLAIKLHRSVWYDDVYGKVRIKHGG